VAGNHKGLPLRKTASHVGAILYGCPPRYGIALSLRYQNVEIKPGAMVSLTQGEMWVIIAQRRYHGGANPVWQKATLTKWSWLVGVRRFSRLQRLWYPALSLMV